MELVLAIIWLNNCSLGITCTQQSVTHSLKCVTDELDYRDHSDTSSLTGFKLTTLVVVGTDCTGSCKSNYHMIMTAPTCQCHAKH